MRYGKPRATHLHGKRQSFFHSSLSRNPRLNNFFQVSLSAYSEDNIDNAEECSGTLISEWHILTSASCVQNRDGYGI